MSEMNTPKDPRTGLSEKLDGILSKDPTNALASALKEALPGLTAAQAEQILNRLNNELPTSKGEEPTHAPQVARVANLIKALRYGHFFGRGHAALALGEIGDKSAVPALCGALKDEDVFVRSRVAEALGEIKDPRAVQPLIEALKDEDKDVREAAVWALGKIKDPRAVEPLIGILVIGRLADQNYWVQQAAARALASIGSPAVEPLLEALKDGDWGVRRRAAWALGEIGDKSAITPLKARLDGFLGIFGGEKVDDVRAEIEAAIKKLEGN